MSLFGVILLILVLILLFAIDVKLGHIGRILDKLLIRIEGMKNG